MSVPNSAGREAHPAVKAFMARQGMTAQDLRTDGRLTLTIDEKYRVHLHTASHNRVALTAKLMSLDGRRTGAVDDALARLTSLAAGKLQRHGSSLCLDERQHTLMLQQTLPANADAKEVEAALADFATVLPFWTNACADEASMMRN